MIKVYQLDNGLQEVLTAANRWVDWTTENQINEGLEVLLYSEGLQSYQEDIFIQSGVIFKKSKRKDTVTYAFNLQDPITGKTALVKLVIKSEDGLYKSHSYTGIDFKKEI